MNLKTISPLILVCLTPMLAACTDSADGPSVAIYRNIVTFDGNGPATANFSFREIDDSPLVTLGVRGSLNDERIPAGTRLLMTYTLPDDKTYGEDCFDVSLRGLQMIYTDTIAPLPYSEIESLKKTIRLTTIYRTGQFINLTASMPALSGRKCLRRADQATLDTDTVRAYLSTSVPEEKPSYNSTQTVSVDISPIWELPTLRAISVEVENTNNPNRTKFIFPKTNAN